MLHFNNTAEKTASKCIRSAFSLLGIWIQQELKDLLNSVVQWSLGVALYLQPLHYIEWGMNVLSRVQVQSGPQKAILFPNKQSNNSRAKYFSKTNVMKLSFIIIKVTSIHFLSIILLTGHGFHYPWTHRKVSDYRTLIHRVEEIGLQYRAEHKI